MVGSAIVRQLEQQVEAGAEFEIIVHDRNQLILLSQVDVQSFFEVESIDAVSLFEAKVGRLTILNQPILFMKI